MTAAVLQAAETVEQLYDLTIGGGVHRALNLHQCVAAALRSGVESRRITPERIAEEFGGLLRHFEGDLALNEIAWRCWSAGDRFSGEEADVVRVPGRRHCFVLITGRFRGVPTADLDAMQREALKRLDAGVAPTEREGEREDRPGEPRPLHTGLPAPLNLAAAEGCRIRDRLSHAALQAFDTLAGIAATAPDSIPGFDTLSVSLDLPIQVPSADTETPAFDRVAHAEQLINSYVRMAGGEVVTPAEEIALALTDLPDRWRTLALHRYGLATGTPEGFEVAAARIGVGAERGRQIMEQVSLICDRNPLPLPRCVAAWSAFPADRLAVTLEEWWGALPASIRPASADDLRPLELLEQWHWIPSAAWIRHEESVIVALEPLTASVVESQLHTVAVALRNYRWWGAVSLEELAESVEAHPDIIRARLMLDPHWRHVVDGWFIVADASSFLSRKTGRWASGARRVRASAMRQKLAKIVRSQRAAGRSCSVPPTPVLRELSVLAPPRPRAASSEPAPARAVASVPPAPPPTQEMMSNKEVKTGFDLNGSQAQYLVDRMLRDGRITVSDVDHYLGEMTREIEQLEERLRVLRAASGVDARAAQPVEPSPPSEPGDTSGFIKPSEAWDQAAPPRRRKVKANLSPETLASRRVQGFYLGLMRKIPEERRGEFRRIASEQGRAAAIDALRAELGMEAQ